MPPARAASLLVLSALLASSALADHLVLQVEDMDGPWRRQTNITGYVGTGFCTSNANPNVAGTVMRTTVSVEQGGRHAVWVRAYTSGNSRRALQAEVAKPFVSRIHFRLGDFGSEEHG